jgi:hypothetical protein
MLCNLHKSLKDFDIDIYILEEKSKIVLFRSPHGPLMIKFLPIILLSMYRRSFNLSKSNKDFFLIHFNLQLPLSIVFEFEADVKLIFTNNK